MTRRLVAFGLSIAGLGTGPDAIAQTPPESAALAPAGAAAPRRPFRGLFDGNEGRQDQRGLTLRLTTAAGYDDDVLAELQGEARPEGSVPAWHGNLAGVVQYVARPGDTGLFHAAVTTQVRTYETVRDVRSATYTAQVRFQAPLWRGATLSGTQMLRSAPYYQLLLIPALPASGPDITPIEMPRQERDLVPLGTIGTTTSATLVHRIGRTRFEYLYALESTHMEAASWDQVPSDPVGSLTDLQAHPPARMTAGAVVQQRAEVTMQRQRGRYGTLRLGYRHYRVQRGDRQGAVTTVHDVVTGGGYERPLSFSRRTTVGVSAGTSILDASDGEQYRLLANATLRHEMGRTWLLRGSYDHGLQFSEALADPLLARTVHAALTGLLNRRTDVSVDAGLSRGQLQAVARGNSFASYQAVARLRIAITRRIALSAEHSYYAYDFDEGGGLPTFLPLAARRQAARLTFDWWLPVYTPRARDAAR